VTSDYLGRERGQLHELRNHLDVLRALTKWAERIEHPTQAPLLAARAFQEMLSGRQGPVALEAPWDFFTHRAHVQRQSPLALFPAPEPDPDQITVAARTLATARAPVIFVGGGALGASAAITELAETLSAPVVSFRAGRGVVSDAHPMGLTVAAGARLWSRCDVADAERAVRTLLPELSRHEVRSSGQAEEIAEAKRAAAQAIQKVQPQVAYLKVIREVLPADGFFVDEMSQVGFASWFAFPVYQPRTFITSGYQGTLGFGFPTALGVKIAYPDRAVVSITGDGGFLFGVQELATAVQYGINLVTIVFNNECYGNVRRDQQQSFAGRLIGSDLVNPDFVRLAESFGVTARRVTSPDALKPALEEALSAAAPRIIEVVTPRDSEVSPWEFLQPKFT
jgi:acetolactate synthase-1/2/3 large subunit